MLQYVAVCFRELQCDVVCCTECSVLQCVAMCCSVLQCVATSIRETGYEGGGGGVPGRG